MSDAHLSVHHLLRQLEERRDDRMRGFRLPEWLEAFVEQVAEHFEPEIDAARAGYICSCGDDGWKVTLFLGVTEMVGGPADGAKVPIGFQFDVEAARSRFDRINAVNWRGFPAGCATNASDVDEAALIVDGVVREHRLRLEVALRPPAHIRPGLLKDVHGRLTPTV